MNFQLLTFYFILNRMKKQNWYLLSAEDVAKQLNTDVENGLKNESVSTLRKKYGENSFEK